MREALAELRAVAREEGLEGYAVAQVKQKLGGLRIYVQGAEGARDRMGPVIRAAQERADATCEFCGWPRRAPGGMAVRPSGRSATGTPRPAGEPPPVSGAASDDAKVGPAVRATHTKELVE